LKYFRASFFRDRLLIPLEGFLQKPPPSAAACGSLSELFSGNVRLLSRFPVPGLVVDQVTPRSCSQVCTFLPGEVVGPTACAWAGQFLDLRVESWPCVMECSPTTGPRTSPETSARACPEESALLPPAERKTCQNNPPGTRTAAIVTVNANLFHRQPPFYAKWNHWHSRATAALRI